MITYVDTSTLLKLVVDEPGSERATTIWRSSTTVASAVLIEVEARAALAAAARSRRLTPTQHQAARSEVVALVANLHLVPITVGLVNRAGSLAEAEQLRGYDAVHLAAALDVGATVLTSADRALCDAASRRGLHVADPLGG